MKFNNIFGSFFKGRVDFDDGSFLEWLHKMALRYHEGNHTMDIGFDYQNGLFNSGRSIITSSIRKWNSPHDEDDLTEEKRKEILDKVIAYCKHHHIKFDIN